MKRISEAGSLIQIVERSNWIDDYEFSGTTAWPGQLKLAACKLRGFIAVHHRKHHLFMKSQGIEFTHTATVVCGPGLESRCGVGDGKVILSPGPNV